MPNNLADWLTYLESLHPKTIALGLERVAQVKQRLNLHPDFPVIVVGGTNGKGSVCAMLESILYAAGYRVGCYTSPHLLHYNERVRIAKQQVSDTELCASFEKIERARKGQVVNSQVSSLTPALSQGERGKVLLPPPGEGWDEGGIFEIPLTYFEFGTLAAMQCFIEHQVDVAILEVGLGGRLDAVNVFDNDCAIVTSVDIDHVDYLGDTREKIAFEKAGIFRKNRVAICADDDVPQAIRNHAKDIGAELWCIGSEFGFVQGDSTVSQPPLTPPYQGENVRSLPDKGGSGWVDVTQWNYRGLQGSRNALPIPALRGAFQLNNASAVLAALDVLKEKLPVSMAAVRRGLTEVQLAGRFQFVLGKPQLILDVAHNPHAARSLAENLANLPACPNTYAIFAMLKDKDMAGVVAALNPHIDTWLVAGIDAPRGASSTELEQVVQQGRVNGEIKSFANIAEAVSFAYKAAGENDRIV
ncbi:MAG: bifunctional folylpolyglutamate synthase/dihydrofolate synthase, partial [Gallionella sp.]|nr:bifunctional folylpolyglutamate synthase/dihydrofolate synthase [Gallionella sp.]